jgi:ribosome-associated translation inhibitor RaiA
MKLSIFDKDGLLSDAALNQIESKLAAALSKFGSRIQTVTLSVSDANGPRGGQDKVCQVNVMIKKSGPVVASVTDASVSKAISRAINRCERGVARRVQKSFALDRDLGSDTGLAFGR